MKPAVEHAGERLRDKEDSVHKGLGRQRLMAVFVGGGLLLNFPLLALWDRDVTWLGLPLFPVALFMLWGALIVLIGWLSERMSD